MIIKSNNKREKPIIILKSFSEQVGKNPMSFLENLIVNAEANDQDEQNFLEVIGGFLKDDTKKWYIKNKS